SIVFGLFGLGFFIQFVGRAMDAATQPAGEVVWGRGSLLWAALTLALLTLPTVIVATEEALRTVPWEQREASLALGATRWETIRRVVLPAALPGILTGGILGISRGAGEVAPILFTGAAYFLPFLPARLSDQFMHLGYHVLILSTQSPDVEATQPILYGTVFVLLVLTFLLNLTGVLIRSRTRARLRDGK
ncbi:MAG TPA: ABC transporter permease subunit, partial [Thermoanaerobaculia bacterium]|nr:ABC transporter permease subunit [Thermoanaerobaculia bacterium]